MTINFNDLNESINKTGFPTEYEVQKKFESHGWYVISNRYYIDDQKKIEREIDLVATKNGVKLVISCKKSDEEFWTFMTSKNLGEKVPFDFKIDDPIVKYFFNFEEDTLYEKMSGYEGFSSLLSVPDSVRAFQQFKEVGYKPNNDKHIYDSIITTIKAADYESTHSTKNAVYFMLSVFNGEMLQKDFDSGEIKAIEDIKYINRHYIGDNEREYCVHFIKFDALDGAIGIYDKVAEEVPQLVKNLHTEFAADIFAHKSRVDFYWKRLEKNFFDELYEYYGNIHSSPVGDLSTFTTNIRWYMSNNNLHLAFDLSLFEDSETLANNINKDEFCRKLMAKLLKQYYDYNGNFVMENDNDVN